MMGRCMARLWMIRWRVCLRAREKACCMVAAFNGKPLNGGLLKGKLVRLYLPVRAVCARAKYVQRTRGIWHGGDLVGISQEAYMRYYEETVYTRSTLPSSDPMP